MKIDELRLQVPLAARLRPPSDLLPLLLWRRGSGRGGRVEKTFWAAGTVGIGCLTLLFSFAIGCSKKEPAAAAAEKADKEESRVHRSTNGEVIIKVDAETQKLMGLKTAPLEAAQLGKEVKGFGRALDPSPLASLVAEVATARTANTASQAELERVKTLAGQDNASARTLQAAEAAAARDRTQAESAQLRLLANWGGSIAEQQDLPALVQSLGKLEAVLVQLNVHPDEALKEMPSAARLMTAASETNLVEAKFLGLAPAADPQVQGQGFLFLVRPNPSHLVPGTSLAGLISIPGEKEAGIALPREAIVRYNGAAWVYVQTSADEFRRTEVNLEKPLPQGWFLHEGLKPEDKVVVTGAQQLLSEELKE
jgi:hypothetical protein